MHASFPLNVEDLYFFKGGPCSNSKQVVFANELDSCSVLPTNFQQITVGIKIDKLPTYLGNEQTSVFLDAIDSEKQISVVNNHKETTANFVLQLYTELLGVYEASPVNQIFVDQYNKLIILHLYEYITNYCNKTKNVKDSSNHERVLDRALHFIFQEGGAPITLDRLSSEIFASKRSIQYAFSELIGMTPISFSKLVRLNAIRSDLLNIHKQSASVSHILHNFHITNSGRFRHEYFDFFGEFPKDTVTNNLA